MDRKVRLETIKQLRIYVASTLAQVLTFYLRSSHPVSETQFRDGWLKELRKNKDIYTDGWYIPPPHGMILIFDTDDNGSRVGASSFRPPDLWPKGNIYLDKQKGLIYAYFSAVHRESGILGDFCVSLYLGTNKDVCLQMQKGLMIDRQIFDFAASGMKLCELAKYSQKLLTAFGLQNAVTSPTDPTGVNIGHTIPASYEDWQPEEFQILRNGEGDWKAVCNAISKKRKFLNEIEEFEVRPGMAFTIEPRISSIENPHVPTAGLHTIALFYENGTKEHLTGFDELFKIAGMEYMLR